MKIDKVVFSTSQRFSCFWNIQSRLWRTKLGVEPVCLLLDKRENCPWMNEEFGRIIEVPVDPKFPLLIQITWSKFWWVHTEPETTWLIGDIDMIPLSTHWFTENIASVPDDHYVHLNADGITQLAHTGSWLEGVIPDKGCPTNLPGHYHVGKGRVLDIGLERSGTFEEELKHIVTSGKYQNTRGFREDDPIEQHALWCGEELRSTRAIRRQIQSGGIQFKPFSLRSGSGCLNGDTLEATAYDGVKIIREPGRVYVDFHSVRPFEHVDEVERAKRWRAIENLLSEVGMI